MGVALVRSTITDQQLDAMRQAGIAPIIAPTASYEGASSGRRLSRWGTSSAGPNSAITGGLSNLRSRSHEFVRNHPLANGAVDTWVSNLVGTGIVPRWKVGPLVSKDLKEQLQQKWLRWTDQSDADGCSDFYGQQALAARAIVESGAALIRRRRRTVADRLAVPLQLQVMEPDHLPHTMTQWATGGNEIQAGIEFDWLGRRAAYHVTRRHPGDQFFGSGGMDTVRVPADDMIHAFRPLRPGQIREVPWLSSVIVSLHELDQYSDAERVRKKIAALFAGFITSPAGAGGSRIDPLTGRPISASRGDNVSLEPGILQYLDPGEEVTFSTPADVGQNTVAWMQQQLREIATGVGLTFEQFTGDLSNVNYSSLRAGLVEFRRRCEALIFHLLVFQICRPIAGWWMDALALSEPALLPGYWDHRDDYLSIEWFGQGWEYVNPVEDRIAEQMDIRNGLDSRQSVIAHRRGRDAEEVDAEIAQDNERADKLGLVLDSDPRKTAQSGAVQKVTEAALAGREK